MKFPGLSLPLLPLVSCAWGLAANLEAAGNEPWTSANRFRLRLGIEMPEGSGTDSPGSIEIDFPELLRTQSTGVFDAKTVEVTTVSGSGSPLPHRLDGLFGLTRATLHFVIPSRAPTNLFVYFDTVESRRGRARYGGLVGDGDKFRLEMAKREVAPSHFDCLVDFDGDGDLDLFRGGVEPFVYCWENVGRNRLEERGRLTSDGKLLALPCGANHRSWVTVAFHDLDGDGDLDFIPSFGDGPDSGRFIFYRNRSTAQGGPPSFERVGPLRTVGGDPVAGGVAAGGWFPSIALVPDWDGDGCGPDALVGSRNRCWLYRNTSRLRSSPSREASTAFVPVFREPIALQAGGREIELINPRFDAGDLDGDGDMDLVAGSQPGAVTFFENVGSGGRVDLAAGRVVAWNGRYLIGDAHSGVKLADLNQDGLLDVVSGRFWERADLNAPQAPRDFGGVWKNTGAAGSRQLVRSQRLALFTETFQPCDAIRQNSVRAVDWNGDGRLDLLAGDTDGFIWYFRNRSVSVASGARRFTVQGHDASARSSSGHSTSLFAVGERVEAAGAPLSVAATGGHARLDVSDWDNDGRLDLVVADGSGGVTLFLNHGSRTRPRLLAGQRLTAGGANIQLGARASVVVCDWDNDGRKDLLLADERGYYFSRNIGSDAAPELAPVRPILFGGKQARYVRPNLGAFVDWDGDGRRDLIGCEFENSIRFYRNEGPGTPGTEPKFDDPQGVTVLRGESPQMISGADVVDWNGDGDLDLLTGQGHGGSGLRFYERDWLEHERARRHPVVTILGCEKRD